MCVYVHALTIIIIISRYGDAAYKLWLSAYYSIYTYKKVTAHANRRVGTKTWDYDHANHFFFYLVTCACISRCWGKKSLLVWSVKRVCNYYSFIYVRWRAYGTRIHSYSYIEIIKLYECVETLLSKTLNRSRECNVLAHELCLLKRCVNQPCY